MITSNDHWSLIPESKARDSEIMNEKTSSKVPEPRISKEGHPQFDAFKERVLANPETRKAYEATERRHERWTFNRTRLITIPSLIAFTIGPAMVAHQDLIGIRLLGVLLWAVGIFGFVRGIRIVERLLDEDDLRIAQEKAFAEGALYRTMHSQVFDPEYSHNPYAEDPRNRRID